MVYGEQRREVVVSSYDRLSIPAGHPVAIIPEGTITEVRRALPASRSTTEAFVGVIDASSEGTGERATEDIHLVAWCGSFEAVTGGPAVTPMRCCAPPSWHSRHDEESQHERRGACHQLDRQLVSRVTADRREDLRR